MKLHVENLKFRYQIIVLFLILFLFLSMGSGISFYYLSVKNVTDNFSNSASNTVGQMRNTLDIRMEIISDRAKAMLLNNAFSDPIVSYVNNPTLYNQVVAHSVVSDYLSDFERGEALIDSSCLFAGENCLMTMCVSENQISSSKIPCIILFTRRILWRFSGFRR